MEPVSKRRVIPTGPGSAEPQRRMRPAVAVGIAVLVVGLVIAGGLGIDLAVRPHPPAAFARCQTASQLAPGVYTAPPKMCIDPKATYDGTMKTTKGDITFVFLTKSAPKTVNNFIVLAENGYFNGQPFWRAEDWVVQAGDPLGNGRGGPGYSLPAEPTASGEQWPPGSLGMARFPDGTTSGSQFFSLKQPWKRGNATSAHNPLATIPHGL